MKINDIKALAELVSKNNLSALEYSEGETHLRIENAPRTVTAAPAVEAAPVAAADVGVFYASPSPTDPPFVTVGSKVKKGDVLCIIEAMKLMNEITAEEDGEIIDICATNGSVVEYGQILFKML